MKTSELTGALLDYWVARIDPQCDGCTLRFIAEHEHGPHYVGIYDDGVVFFIPAETSFRQALKLKWQYKAASQYQPTASWQLGGPIIQRERIIVAPISDDEWTAEKWHGATTTRNELLTTMDGPTPLIAAMRAYVASKFGDEVHEAA